MFSGSNLKVSSYSGSLGVNLVLKIVPKTINIILFLFCSLVIVFEMDFLNYGLKLVFHNNSFLLNLVMVAIRGLYFYVMCKILFVFLIVSLQLIVFESYLLSGIMQTLVAISKLQVNVSVRNHLAILLCKCCNYTRQNELLNIHAHAKILEIICNQVYWLYLPLALLLGGLTLIFASYEAIRMHAVIPMPYYLGFPILAIFVILVIASL